MAVYTYPVALDLTDRRCLVVGDGALALEKVEGLLRAGADVRAVASQPIPQLERLAAKGALTLHRRSYTPADLQQIYLVYGASEDRTLNARVADDARACGVLVNAVDDIPHCDFFAMALVRRGDLQVAVSTNGRSPAFARWLRERLQEQIPTEFGDLLSALGDARNTIRSEGEVPGYAIWKAAITDELEHHKHAGSAAGRHERLLAALRGVDGPVPVAGAQG